jgi:uncharacterized membrane protein
MVQHSEVGSCVVSFFPHHFCEIVIIASVFATKLTVLLPEVLGVLGGQQNFI